MSCKLVSTLINSDPVKSFVTCKTVCFSNVGMAKEFNSVKHCLVTCTEHPVNVISSVVRMPVLSYRTACPVHFDIVVTVINVTLLFTYHRVSFKIPPRISPTVISVSELSLHLARPPATLSVCSPLSASSILKNTILIPNILAITTTTISIIIAICESCYYHHHHLHHHHNQLCHYHLHHHHHHLLHPHNQLSSFHHHHQRHQHEHNHYFNSWPIYHHCHCRHYHQEGQSLVIIVVNTTVFLSKQLFMIFFILLFDVILMFDGTKMVLGFNSFSIFILLILIYAKFYTKFSLNLTCNITWHKCFLLWLFNCFYICQIFKIAWIIDQKNSTFTFKFFLHKVFTIIKA